MLTGSDEHDGAEDGHLEPRQFERVEARAESKEKVDEGGGQWERSFEVVRGHVTDALQLDGAAGRVNEGRVDDASHLHSTESLSVTRRPSKAEHHK